MSGLKILVPWYAYPPHSRERVGGLSVSLWEITHGLKRRGLEVEILVPGKGEDQFESVDGIRVIRSALGRDVLDGKAISPSQVKKLVDTYDWVISFNNYGSGALFASRTAVEKVVRYIHTLAIDRPISSYVSLESGLFEYGRMFVLRRREIRAEKRLKDARTLCVSGFLEERMLHFRLTERNLTRVIPNGVDTENFRPSPTEKVQDILFVGRFQKVKGLDILLSSLKYLFLSERRRYKVGVVGPFSPDQRAVLMRNVPEELREKIEFYGTVPHEDMPHFFNSSRLVVMPSRYETFGLPALEGIACGIPVVASNVGGLPEIVNEEVGLLFEAGDSAALAKAISKGMGEEVADATMKNGPTMAKRFDWRVICDQLAGALST